MQILKKTKLLAYKKAKSLGPEKTIKLITEKGLTGRAGGGFPTGKKWEITRNTKEKEKYLICNADEGEPGTFKDRMILEKNPETLIEGIIIAAETIGAKKAYIYLRAEYSSFKKNIEKKISEILKKTRTKTKIEIFSGAGAYICGEETAIISSIEGMRGQAKKRPPYPTVEGLFGKPTVINNVETLTNIPLLINYPDWKKNLRLFSVSGNVSKPGVYELSTEKKLKDLLEIAEPRKRIKAVYFGCSGGCISYKENKEMKLSFEKKCEKNCVLGTNTIIFVEEDKDIVEIATNIAKFYEFESCGKCTPCREGTFHALKILEKISLGKATEEDLENLQDLGEVVTETSFCGLGQVSMKHLLTALKYFKKEFKTKIKKNKRINIKIKKLMK
jgi:NADH-quinone oxidoreductase subunit F